MRGVDFDPLSPLTRLLRSHPLPPGEGQGGEPVGTCHARGYRPRGRVKCRVWRLFLKVRAAARVSISESGMSEKWTPQGWRSKPIQQAPVYPDKEALAAIEARIATYPPLVF